MRRRSIVLSAMFVALVALPADAGGDAWEYPQLDGQGWPVLQQGEQVRAVAALDGWASPESWEYPVGQPMLAYLVPIDAYTWNPPQLPQTGYLVGVVTPIDGPYQRDGERYGGMHLRADIEVPELPTGTYWLANCDLSCRHELGGFTSAGVEIVEGTGRSPEVLASEVEQRVAAAELARTFAIEGGEESIRLVRSFSAQQSVPARSELRTPPSGPLPPVEIDDRERALVQMVEADSRSASAPAREASPASKRAATPGWPAAPILIAAAALIAGMSASRATSSSERFDESASSGDRILVSV